MAINKNALIRYRTIDKCLQNRYRRWTLNDLIQACSDALYDSEARDTNISKRTLQLDIQNMRSDKLGYNAPIEVYDRKYYRYADPEYTITDIPLSGVDMDVLLESMEILKQFKGFSLFKELEGIRQRLEDRIYTEKNKSPAIIHFDKNESLKGLEFLEVLYQSILKKIALKVTYQSFAVNKPTEFIFHAYFLKEYNNRWFVIGKHRKQDSFRNLALDRIVKIDYDLDVEYLEEAIDADTYYKNTIGATVLSDR